MKGHQGVDYFESAGRTIPGGIPLFIVHCMLPPGIIIQGKTTIHLVFIEILLQAIVVFDIVGSAGKTKQN
jgi:hypothetical protein